MELDSIAVQYEQVDSRSGNLARQCSAFEMQLAEAQRALVDEKQLQATSQSHVRELEELAAELQDKLEEQTDHVKQQELKINMQSSQVGSNAIGTFYVLTVIYSRVGRADVKKII